MALIKNRVFILTVIIFALGIIWIIFHGKFSEQNELLITPEIIKNN